VPPLLLMMALPAFEVLRNCVTPPPAPRTVPPLLVIVALPAVEVPKNPVMPAIAPLTVPLLLVIMALPAVEVSKNSVWPPFAPLTVPALLVIVALPAVEVLANSMRPPAKPLTMAPLLRKEVMLPAVALFVKFIVPWSPDPSTAVTKFCVIPESLLMPKGLTAALMVNALSGSTVMVNELAPELKWIANTVIVAAEVIETPVVLETPNVATSDDPLGNPVLGFQLLLLSQLPSTGVASHVALPAKMALCIESKSKVAVATSNDVCVFLEKLNLVFI
jgi:hypothetical protein